MWINRVACSPEELLPRDGKGTQIRVPRVASYSLGWQRRRRPTWKRCRVKDDNRRDSLTSSGGWGKGWKRKQSPAKKRKEANGYSCKKRNGKIVSSKKEEAREKLCCKRKRAVTGKGNRERVGLGERKREKTGGNKRKLWATKLWHVPVDWLASFMSRCKCTCIGRGLPRYD